jgi:hypothetical protein
MILIYSLIIVIILYFRNLSKANEMLLGLINIILLYIMILISNINLKFKIVLFLIVSFVFKNNVYVLLWLLIIISKAYFGFYKNQKDNSVLRKEVTFLFSSLFNFNHNFQMLPKFPTIIVANYATDTLEKFASIMIPKDLAIIMDVKVAKLSGLKFLIKDLLIRNGEYKNNYNSVKEKIKKYIQEGKSIFVYVSKCAYFKKGYLGKVRTGIFSIAKDLNVPITQVSIDTISNWKGIINSKQNFQMKIGETFLVKDIKKDVERTKAFFKQNMITFEKEKFKN